MTETEVLNYLVNTKKQINLFGYGHIDNLEIDAIDKAIQALKEKQEREKGCEYCKNGRPLVVGETNDKGISIWSPNILHAYGYDFHGYGVNGIGAKIKCCPMCGRKLEVQP